MQMFENNFGAKAIIASRITDKGFICNKVQRVIRIKGTKLKHGKYTLRG